MIPACYCWKWTLNLRYNLCCEYYLLFSFCNLFPPSFPFPVQSLLWWLHSVRYKKLIDPIFLIIAMTTFQVWMIRLLQHLSHLLTLHLIPFIDHRKWWFLLLVGRHTRNLDQFSYKIPQIQEFVSFLGALQF